MTIKKKDKQSFLGIIVSDTNQLSAVAKYCSVSRCEDTAVVGSNNMLMATASSDILFDPLTGDGTLSAHIGAEQQLQSQSSVEDNVDAFFSVCADGCNHVIVSDFEPEFCVNCSAALPELSDEETLELMETTSHASIEDLEDDMKIDNKFGVVVAGATYEDAEALYLEVANGEDTANSYESESGSFQSHSSCAIGACPISGEETDLADDVEVDLASMSSEGTVNPHYYQCAGDCETPHIISQSADAVFCPSCSSGLVDPEMIEEIASMSSEEEDDFLEEDFEADASVDEDDDEDDMSDLDEDEDDDDDIDLDDDSLESESSVFDSFSSADNDAEDDDEDEDDMSDLEDDEEDEDEDMESDSFFALSGDEEDEDDEDEDDEDDEDDDMSDLEDDEDDDDDIDLEADDDMESESSHVADIEIDLLSSISASEGGLTPERVSISNVGTIEGSQRVVAFYGVTPVAMASQSSVSDEAKAIFNQPAFIQASISAVNELGVDEGLADMGFERIVPDIDIDAVVEASVYDNAENRVKDMENRIESTLAEQGERHIQAVSSAMMAANRQQFRGLNNPIADALVSNMVASGFSSESANALVSNAFESHSDAYVKLVADKAKDLTMGSLETQNQFAELVATSNFSSKSSADTNSIEDRLITPMSSKSKTAPAALESNSATQQSDESFQDRMSRVVNSL